jgi:hypothetical protein
LIAHISEPSLAINGKQLQPSFCESGFKKAVNLFIIKKGIFKEAQFELLLEETCGLPAHSLPDSALNRRSSNVISAKLVIFVLAIEIMALAVGYLMRGRRSPVYPSDLCDGRGDSAGASALVKADKFIMVDGVDYRLIGCQDIDWLRTM